MHDRYESDRDPGDEQAYDPEFTWHINGLLESMKMIDIEEVSPDIELAD